MGTWKLTDWETSPGATKLQKQGGWTSDGNGFPSMWMAREWHRVTSPKAEESTLALEISYRQRNVPSVRRTCSRGVPDILSEGSYPCYVLIIRAFPPPAEDWHPGDSPPPDGTIIERIVDDPLPNIVTFFQGIQPYAEAVLAALLEGSPMLDERLQ